MHEALLSCYGDHCSSPLSSVLSLNILCLAVSKPIEQLPFLRIGVFFYLPFVDAYFTLSALSPMAPGVPKVLLLA